MHIFEVRKFEIANFYLGHSPPYSLPNHLFKVGAKSIGILNQKDKCLMEKLTNISFPIQIEVSCILGGMRRVESRFPHLMSKTSKKEHSNLSNGHTHLKVWSH